MPAARRGTSINVMTRVAVNPAINPENEGLSPIGYKIVSLFLQSHPNSH